MGHIPYHSTLYIRPAYHSFWEMINGEHHQWIITGTPGIGKTFFAFFMFSKIRETQPDSIIARVDAYRMFIFYPNGDVYSPASRTVPDEIASDEKNWVIADAVTTRFEGMNCRTVVLTSPRMEGYKRHRKAGFQVRCMPVWDLEEIRTVHARVYPHLDLTKVEDIFEIWGGVPRTVLQFANDKSWQRHLRSSLHISTIENCMKFDGGESYESIDDVCGRLVHEVPMDDKYIDTQVRWASQKLASFALDALVSKNATDAMNLVLSTQGIGSFGSLRGHLFEKLGHRIVSAGGTFTVRDLETGSISEETFDSRQVF